MKNVFTLWVQGGDLDIYTQMSVKSWIKYNLKVTVWTYEPISIKMIKWYPEVDFKNANEIVGQLEDKTYPEIADHFRFYYLYHFGGTWIDSDLVLINSLPEDEIIISSEHSKQKGAFSTKDRDYTPNIGVLRFPPQHPIIKETMKKINKLIVISYCSNNNNNTLMKIFQKIVLKDHRHLVSHPNLYCPISWSYVRDLYYKPDVICNGKYGIDQKNMKYIKENSIGIHLWRNLAAIYDLPLGKTKSIFFQLKQGLI